MITIPYDTELSYYNLVDGYTSFSHKRTMTRIAIATYDNGLTSIENYCLYNRNFNVDSQGDWAYTTESIDFATIAEAFSKATKFKSNQIVLKEHIVIIDHRNKNNQQDYMWVLDPLDPNFDIDLTELALIIC